MHDEAGAVSGSSLPPGLSVPDPLLVFDGVCVLCSGTVQSVLRHERAPDFRFTPVQSTLGQRVLAALDQPLDGNDSMVVIDGGRYFLKSDAVVQVARHLKAPRSWAVLVRFLPRRLRDGLYERLARNRYRLFGRYESCMVPDPALRERFLS